uniref:DH31-like receptor 1 n=1 Tax=Platynereis dumerilii TaxID=6359 RepID=A0A0K0PVL8_PLADU|nr:DH31-like receptor 1 [Platynereis dumerilii]
MASAEDLAIQAAAIDCYENVIFQDSPFQEDELYCNATWDEWGCWNYTKAGSRAFISCPSYKEGFDASLWAYKDCNPDGTWWLHPITNRSWANYTACVNMNALETDKRVVYIFVAGYAISIVFLLLSLIIFFYFRQLQCDRVTLHKNLFISYILNGIAWILYYTLASLDGEVLSENPAWCQFLHVVTQYFVTCNFFWMFCEGFYLHTIIVSAFTTGKTLIIFCFIVGWGAPFVSTVIYGAARGVYPSKRNECWMDESFLQWIVLGPILLTIVLNLFFLCNIVRVLITKLRAVNSPDTNQTRKAVRATLILIPLLGLQYILLPFRPNDGSPLLDVYLHVSALVTAFQGLFVSTIFCFFNGEVISVLKRKWGQHRLMQGNGTGRATTLYTQTTVTMAENSGMCTSRL